MSGLVTYHVTSSDFGCKVHAMMTPAIRGSLRVAWTIATLLVVQTLICATAVAPIITSALWLRDAIGPSRRWQVAIIAVGTAPAYAAFALGLLIVTPLALRLTGWRSPAAAEMVITDLEWPLLRWVRFLAVIHVARFFAGGLLRGTPLWTLHIRWCGATLGRRVFINSLAVSDYNLLNFGDDVVIGGDAHVSGHTVEAGVVKTGGVTLGHGVTIGLGAVVEPGAEIAAGCQIGAMSFVPKHARLLEPGIYVGVPVAPLAQYHARAPGGERR